MMVPFQAPFSSCYTSHGLTSLQQGVYIGDYIGDYYSKGILKGILGVQTISYNTGDPEVYHTSGF